MARRLRLLIEVALCALLLFAGGALRARTGRGWTFTGADGYAYMGAATELLEHHHYAIRPPPWFGMKGDPPLGSCRLPGYPLFLAAVGQPAEPPGNFDPMIERARPVQHLIDLLTCLLVYLMARALAGPLAGLLGLALAALHPTLVMFSSAILTETLATFLTTLCLALLLWAILRPPRGPRGPAVVLALAGVAAGLCALVRLDGLVLFPLLVLAPLLRRPRRLRPGLLALACAALCFAPWPLRNWARFGTPRLGGVCDIRGQDMTRAAFLGWFATWLEQESQTPDTLYCFFRPGCVPWIGSFPLSAFDSAAERRHVLSIFLRIEREGYSAAVDESMRQLTRERIRRHPLRTLVALPLVRARHLWLDPSDQPISSGVLPWPERSVRVVPWLGVVSVGTCALGLLGVLALALLRALRPAALLFALALATRTGFLALIGFVDNRYVLELTPLCLVGGGAVLALAALGLGDGLGGALRRALRRLGLHHELVGQRPGP